MDDLVEINLPSQRGCTEWQRCRDHEDYNEPNGFLFILTRLSGVDLAILIALERSLRASINELAITTAFEAQEEIEILTEEIERDNSLINTLIRHARPLRPEREAEPLRTGIANARRILRHRAEGRIVEDFAQHLANQENIDPNDDFESELRGRQVGGDPPPYRR